MGALHDPVREGAGSGEGRVVMAQQNPVLRSPCAAEAATRHFPLKRVLPVHGHVPSRGFSRASTGRGAA
jgi:hypothetical protein